ncbi:MAG: MBL fold metallo-hydrolase [Planctomycetia bacterium]|nr:MBL fold metallo-hydrolase [Planctomycetia bacterium]
MTLRFTVLASGSSGNASLIQTDAGAVLLDIGLGPRQLTERFAAVGASWEQIAAVLLTHTHGDHWSDRTLGLLRRRQIPLYCHPLHHPGLLGNGQQFQRLLDAGLVRDFDASRDFDLGGGLRCRALALSHDCQPTFGFRFEKQVALFGPPAALGYAADLGCWSPALAAALADVDLLAIEFNHDVGLEYASGRSAQLIYRVLGDGGHLSNAQAAALLEDILRRSTPGRLRHVVQLHLSRDCNRVSLAQEAARVVAQAANQELQIHSASQHRPGPTLLVGNSTRSVRPARRTSSTPRRRAAPTAAPWLPGFEP